jgi:hypothetical protein
VPASSQLVVDLLVGSAMKDPLEWIVGRNVDKVVGANGKDSETPSSRVSSKTLRIEDQTFNTVSATLRSVVLLQDYARVVVSLDVIVSDTMNRIVEYLKVSSGVCRIYSLLIPLYPTLTSHSIPELARSCLGPVPCDLLD